MNKTNRRRVLNLLRSIAPEQATNRLIQERTGIATHGQVYRLTQGLMQAGLIKGLRRGREWVFWVGASPFIQQAQRASFSQIEPPKTSFTPRTFSALAQDIMSAHFGIPLAPGEVPSVSREFDLVSSDLDIVGDARYVTPTRGKRPPPAKLSNVSEHVWLLEKTGAPVTFLVFGNDRRVPELWLERYGALAPNVAFYFLTDSGELERLPIPTSNP
jgi:pimeloyl-ACP methyl ester carboxylesterase